MKFIVELAFDGNPERLEHRPAHRERVRALHDEGTVLMAGPYADNSGALIVFEVADTGELERLLAEDGYYRAPGVSVVSRREWAPIVG